MLLENYVIINLSIFLKLVGENKFSLKCMGKLKFILIFLSVIFCLDPHVRVAGRPNDVKLAREKIIQLLDTRVST